MRSGPGPLAPTVQGYCRFSSKNTIFGRFQKAFFASISTPSPVREKSPPINPNHLSIYTRMASFRKIVWKFWEISSKIAYNRYSMGGRLLRARSGTLPPPRLSKSSQKETATKNDVAAWQVGLYCRRKAGGPARLRSGERGPTGIAARSTSHSLRYASLRSD